MIIYKIQGRDVREYGLFVGRGVGLLDPPTPKRNRYQQMDLHLHGEMINRQKVYFETRKITLTCSIIANNATQFLDRINNIKNLLQVKGTFRLEVFTPAEHPLVYEVYCSQINLEPTVWRNGKMATTCTINLVEPEPIKRVYKVVDTSQEVVVNNVKGILLNVYRSNSIAIEQKEKRMVLYPPFTNNEYIIISGDLGIDDEITLSNAMLIWR